MAFGFAVTVGVMNLSSCVTPQENPNLPNLMTTSDYSALVERYTVTSKIYDGFYQTLQISTTLMNTAVSRGQLDMKARYYQWSQDQYLAAKSETETSLSRETKFFASVFVPERKHDDLNKPKTLWKVFLDAGGRRYEGKVEKIKAVLIDVQSIFPQHNRFSTPYVVTFPVSISMVENTESSLTVTGPVGSTTMKFKPAE